MMNTFSSTLFFSNGDVVAGSGTAAMKPSKASFDL
jgi:hypothetical protein